MCYPPGLGGGGGKSQRMLVGGVQLEERECGCDPDRLSKSDHSPLSKY